MTLSVKWNNRAIWTYCTSPHAYRICKKVNVYLPQSIYTQIIHYLYRVNPFKTGRRRKRNSGVEYMYYHVCSVPNNIKHCTFIFFCNKEIFCLLGFIWDAYTEIVGNFILVSTFEITSEDVKVIWNNTVVGNVKYEIKF